jgi:hypothetical protein
MRVLTDPLTLKELLRQSKIKTTERLCAAFDSRDIGAEFEGLAQTTFKVLPIAIALALFS